MNVLKTAFACIVLLMSTVASDRAFAEYREPSGYREMPAAIFKESEGLKVFAVGPESEWDTTKGRFLESSEMKLTRFGFKDASGKVVIEPKYLYWTDILRGDIFESYKFREGRASVQLTHGKMALVDRKGETIAGTVHDVVQYLKPDGPGAGAWRFIDRDDTNILNLLKINKEYETIVSLSDPSVTLTRKEHVVYDYPFREAIQNSTALKSYQSDEKYRLNVHLGIGAFGVMSIIMWFAARRNNRFTRKQAALVVPIAAAVALGLAIATVIAIGFIVFAMALAFFFGAFLRGSVPNGNR